MTLRFINLPVSITIFVLIIVGCEKDRNPISATSDFDTRLIGEWFYTESLPMNYPAPRDAFYGMQITSDQTINQLGVEIRTGKVVALDDSRYVELIQADDGILVVKVFASPDLRIDTMYYDVKKEQLLLSNEYFERTYTRTELGSQIADPVDFDFTTLIDGILYKGVEVHSYPPSFASRISDTGLLIRAIIPNIHIEIEINSFHGVGTYQITFEKGKLVYDGGDYFLPYSSDSSNIGTVSITNYSETENTCTGSFSFDAIRLDYINNTSVIVRKKLREGSFHLPLYK